ncbi:MAG: endonuclease/exonuclease/phosphatase family protein [Planctomycetaceae bacterium]
MASIRRALGRWFQNLFLAATLILLATTLLSTVARNFWIADLLANLRIQQVLGLLVCIAVHTGFQSWKLVVLIGAGLLFHAPAYVADYRYCRSDAVAARSGISQTDAGTLRVTTANVLTSNRRYADIANELLASDADVVAIIEISTALRDFLSADFSRQYPHSVFYVQDSGNFGIALYSRIPWTNAALTHFNDNDLKSVVATINHSGQTWHIFATHTLPPVGRQQFAHRNQHLQMLSDEVKRLRSDDPTSHVVVMGDLNITPWSPIFQDFAGNSELRRHTSGPGIRPTWYRFPAFAFGLVIDHVLSTDNLSSDSCSVGADVGSDHRFVTVQLRSAL